MLCQALIVPYIPYQTLISPSQKCSILYFDGRTHRSNHRFLWANLWRIAFQTECSELGPRLHGTVPGGQACQYFQGMQEAMNLMSCSAARCGRLETFEAECTELRESLQEASEREQAMTEELKIISTESCNAIRFAACASCAHASGVQGHSEEDCNVVFYVLCVHASRVGSHVEEYCNTVFCVCMPAEL